MNSKMLLRFNQLKEEIEIVEKTKEKGTGDFSRGKIYVDQNVFKEWSLKVQNLIILTSTENSMYYKEFEKTKKSSAFITNANIFENQKSLFNALKNDYEGGYLTSLEDLIHAEVFDSELEQAKELLDKKYKLAAAVIAGVVLETNIRNICTQNKISHGKLDKMNSELAKKGVYTVLKQKKITALADIRNSAAHGKDAEFTHKDVEDMIHEIENFLEYNLQ